MPSSTAPSTYRGLVDAEESELPRTVRPAISGARSVFPSRRGSFLPVRLVGVLVAKEARWAGAVGESDLMLLGVGVHDFAVDRDQEVSAVLALNLEGEGSKAKGGALVWEISGPGDRGSVVRHSSYLDDEDAIPNVTSAERFSVMILRDIAFKPPRAGDYELSVTLNGTRCAHFLLDVTFS